MAALFLFWKTGVTWSLAVRFNFFLQTFSFVFLYRLDLRYPPTYELHTLSSPLGWIFIFLKMSPPLWVWFQYIILFVAVSSPLGWMFRDPCACL